MAKKTSEKWVQTSASALQIDAVKAYDSESGQSGIYVSASADNDGNRGKALASILKKNDETVFSDSGALRAALVSEGLSETDALKMCLMVRSDGFRQLITSRNQAAQSDMDRFIQSAKAQTGFSSEELLSLAKDICYAIDLPFDACDGVPSAPSGSPYVIPSGLYQEDLQEVEQAMRSFLAKQSQLDQKTMEQMIQLARMGIPRAKYLYSLYLFTSAPDYRITYANDEFSGSTEGEEVSRGEALRYLAEAADEGEPCAAAMMGDFLYHRNKNDDWNRAYHYYTGYGTFALTRNRRYHIESILNRVAVNSRTILSCVVLLLLFMTVILLSPGAEIFQPHVRAGMVCFVFALVWTATALFRHHKDPFIKMDSAPVVIFACWLIYTVIRLM